MALGHPVTAKSEEAINDLLWVSQVGDWLQEIPMSPRQDNMSFGRNAHFSWLKPTVNKMMASQQEDLGAPGGSVG